MGIPISTSTDPNLRTSFSYRHHVSVPFNGEPKTLSEQIVNYRRLLGITQKELAKSLGVDPGTLGRWERGKGYPQAKHLKKVTEFLETASPDGQT
jgi:DNA-binding XRE family transcriptional regulator